MRDAHLLLIAIFAAPQRASLIQITGKRREPIVEMAPALRLFIDDVIVPMLVRDALQDLREHNVTD